MCSYKYLVSLIPRAGLHVFSVSLKRNDFFKVSLSPQGP